MGAGGAGAGGAGRGGVCPAAAHGGAGLQDPRGLLQRFLCARALHAGHPAAPHLPARQPDGRSAAGRAAARAHPPAPPRSRRQAAVLCGGLPALVQSPGLAGLPPAGTGDGGRLRRSRRARLRRGRPQRLLRKPAAIRPAGAYDAGQSGLRAGQRQAAHRASAALPPPGGRGAAALRRGRGPERDGLHDAAPGGRGHAGDRRGTGGRDRAPARHAGDRRDLHTQHGGAAQFGRPGQQPALSLPGGVYLHQPVYGRRPPGQRPVRPRGHAGVCRPGWLR